MGIFSIQGQDAQTLAADIENQRAIYLFGKGTGADSDEADRQALYMLISQISISVKAKYEESSEWGLGTDAKSQIRSVVKTYSNATLQSTEQLVWGEEPEVTVFRYIERASLATIFAQRAEKIAEFTRLADSYVQDHKIGDALRNYYWALLLLNTHPEQKSLTYKNQSYSTYLPRQINDLLGSVQIKVLDNKVEQDFQTITLKFAHQNVPVQNISYTYWTGRKWTRPTDIHNAQGLLEFNLSSAKPLTEVKVRLEYKFKDIRIDKEVDEVRSSVSAPSFNRKAQRILSLSESKITKAESNLAAEQKEVESKTSNTDLETYQVETKDMSAYLDQMGQVLHWLKTGNFTALKNESTARGRGLVEKLLEYGKVRVLPYSKLTTLEVEGNVQVRSVPMQFSFKSNQRQFTEQVVFEFDEDKKLDNIAFGLNPSVEKEIMTNNSWSEDSRITLINFIEDYKTAYALKRLDYLESVFSDDALIIVGRLIERKDPEDHLKNHKIVKRTRYSKAQYIRNLGQSFQSKEYINLSFEDITFRRGGSSGDVFGVQIKQYYHSSNYGDQGYLFLMVDLENPAKPIIQVRTWQPEKGPDGKIYSLFDF